MLKRILLAGAAGALFAAPSLAAVQGSHHDLSTWNSANQEVCLFCHGITSTASNAGFGAIGDLCVSRCHIGASGYGGSDAVRPNRPASMNEAGAAIPPQSTTDAIRVDDGYAHGLVRNDLWDPTGATNHETFSALGEALPYANAATGELECTSCHNVHDYTNTPFLQRDLFTGGPAGRPSFCEACHTTRGNSWSGGETAPNGEHPTNFALRSGEVSGTAARTNAERLGRYIALDAASNTTWPAQASGAAASSKIFDVPTPNGASLSANDVNYRTGGKLSGWVEAPTPANPAVNGGTFGCYTCHSAHMDATVGNHPNLILRDGYSADGEWNPLCVGCHGDVANGADDPNPGRVATTFYHPVGTTANAGAANEDGLAATVYRFLTDNDSFAFNVDLTAISTLANQGALTDGICGINGGTNAGSGAVKPRCTSCHDVHGGISNSMVLLDLDGTRDGTYTSPDGTTLFCDACHRGEGLPDKADNVGQPGETMGTGTLGSHHRTRASSWAAGNITDADGDSLVMNAASWAGASTQTLGCADCHVFDGSTHFTAHNW